jgi:SAM-dependent methyltransferase
MEATQDYYETYWSAEGHCPVGAISDDVRRVLAHHVGHADRCLDVGCGDGRTAGVWLRDHAGAYTGVDISANAVEMARVAGLDARCIDDAAELPFGDASFDVVVCLEVLEHLFDPQLAAAEIARVLRPGGTFIATVPNVSHWKTRLDLAVRGRWNPRGDALSVAQPWRDPHLRFFTADSLARMLRGGGFAAVAVSGRQGSIARNVPRLERFARTEPGPIGRALIRRLPVLGAGLCAVAVTPRVA